MKKLTIAIDFDDTLHINGEPIKERCEIVRKLIEYGHNIYILTASLQPTLNEVEGDYFITGAYISLHNRIYTWLNDNIMWNEWLITPIKQHITDYYVDANCMSWTKIEDILNGGEVK